MEKGQPLSGVNIYMQKDSIGIGVTDIKGEFRFAHNKMGLSDTIIFSYVGYSSFKCTLSELRHLEYKVSMYELPQLLHEVVVSGERPPFFLEWTSLASLPKPLYSFGGFLHDGKIYVVAGMRLLSEWFPINTGKVLKLGNIVPIICMYMTLHRMCGKMCERFCASCGTYRSIL